MQIRPLTFRRSQSYLRTGKKFARKQQKHPITLFSIHLYKTAGSSVVGELSGLLQPALNVVPMNPEGGRVREAPPSAAV